MANYAFLAEPGPKKDPNLTDPFEMFRPDICPHCNAQLVECYSYQGYPQKYSEAVDLYMKGYQVRFDKYDIFYMKCNGCGKSFVIDWSTGFPMPMRDSYTTDVFFSEFMSGI